MLSVILLPLMTWLLMRTVFFNLTSEILVNLLIVVIVAVVGGLWPALFAAVVASILATYFLTIPFDTWSIASFDDLVAVGVFIVVALVVALLVERVVHLTARAAQASAEAARVQQMTEIDRVRTALLAAVSHDLRSPLAAATAAVASLRSPSVKWTAEERRELTETADQSLQRLGTLIENLLDYSRLQAGVLPLAIQPVPADDIVQTVITGLGPAGHGVISYVPEDIPEVMADAALLARVLENLLTNALRFSAPEQPPVIVGDDLGQRVELKVIDHGPGIPADQRVFVTKPFQRLGDQDDSTGVGLGMALALGLTEAMGGQLTMDDTPGGGLTAVVTLRSSRAAGEP